MLLTETKQLVQYKKGGTMKDRSEKSTIKASEREVIATFIIKSEQKREKAFRDFVRAEIGSASAGKRIILNSK
jgi:hypothetical protein